MEEKLKAHVLARDGLNAFMHHNFNERVEVERDYAVCKLDIRPESLNPFGMVHGGALCTLADNAAGVAAHTDGRLYVTQSSTFNFLKNQGSGTIYATARVRHPGPHHRAGGGGYHRGGRKAAVHGGVHHVLRGRRRDEVRTLSGKRERTAPADA